MSEKALFFTDTGGWSACQMSTTRGSVHRRPSPFDHIIVDSSIIIGLGFIPNWPLIKAMKCYHIVADLVCESEQCSKAKIEVGSK